jgi:fructokinase
VAGATNESRGSVLSIGEILIDFIVDDRAASLAAAREFVARPGGAPANAAVALARLGIKSAFCGVVGADPFGDRLRSALTHEGVDSSRLRQTDLAATTLAFAWKDQQGDGHFWLLRGADAMLSPEDVAAAGIDQLAALTVGSVALAAEPSRSAIKCAVTLAEQSGVPVFFDVNYRPTIWADRTEAAAICDEIAKQSSIVKFSLDDAIELSGSPISPDTALGHFLALGPRTVVMTDGERGSWFATLADPVVKFVSAFPVQAIEPTGAGDAFGAALIARALDSGWESPVTEDIRYAAAAGALATTKRGAWEGLPSRRDLKDFLAKR